MMIQPSPPVQWKHIRKWGLQSQADQTYVHQFTGSDRGEKQNEAPHINKDSSPLSVLMLYFTSAIDMLVRETNRYYHQYLDTCGRTPNPLPDITNSKMCMFLAIAVQMGHNVSDRLSDYWTRTEQFLTPFYLNTMTRDHFLHILKHYLHFTTQKSTRMTIIMTVWEIREVFDIQNFTTLLNIWQLTRWL